MTTAPSEGVWNTGNGYIFLGLPIIVIDGVLVPVSHKAIFLQPQAIQNWKIKFIIKRFPFPVSTQNFCGKLGFGFPIEPVPRWKWFTKNIVVLNSSMLRTQTSTVSLTSWRQYLTVSANSSSVNGRSMSKGTVVSLMECPIKASSAFRLMGGFGITS